MSSVMKRFIKGLVLKGLTDESDIASKDGAGAVFYNKTDARIKTYIENSIREILTNSQDQVLTNKTIDYNLNTLKNIPGLQTNVDIFNTTVTIGTSASTATGLLYYKATKNMELTSIYAQLFEKNGVSAGTLEVDVKKGSTPDDLGQTVYTTLEDFESGSFLTNGWTVVNGAQVNKFYVGSATSNTGTKSAYISNDNGVSNTYGNSPSVVWFYKDIVIPPNSTYLKFQYKLRGETTYDIGRFILDTTASIVPQQGVDLPALAVPNIPLTNTYNNWDYKQISISSYIGTTVRLIFGWKNDGLLEVSPSLAIDNIEIISQINPYNTICSIKPSFNFTTASNYDTSNGTLSTTTISAGNYLRLDLSNIPSGFAGHVHIILTGAITA